MASYGALPAGSELDEDDQSYGASDPEQQSLVAARARPYQQQQLADEDNRLLHKQRPPVYRPETFTAVNLFSIVAVLFIIIVIAGTSILLTSRGSSSDADADADTAVDTWTDDGSFSFTFFNVNYPALAQFTDADSLLKYKILEGYAAVIEPSQPTSLYISAGRHLYSSFNTTICPRDSQDSSALCATIFSSGFPDVDAASAQAIFTQSCEPGDDFHIAVVATDAAGGQTTLTGKAKCLYVRREIRALTDADLQRMLDAMYATYNTSDAEGSERYGGNFLSNGYMTRMHHYNSAVQDADHIHEGNGFLAQHIKMTNMFEKSMQSVDPSVSMPYWDYTIDEAEGTAVFESPLFSANVFGTMTMPSNLLNGFTYTDDDILLGAIPDGRWAFQRADVNTEYADLQFGYGYMRAPWNMNPSPYVSRFAAAYSGGVTLPSCLSHYNLLKKTSLMTFSYDIAYAPHAGPHSLVGGTYGCDKLRPLLDNGYISSEDKMFTLCAKWLFLLKEFYRNNNFSPRANCVAAAEPEPEPSAPPSAAPSASPDSSQKPTRTPTDSFNPALPIPSSRPTRRPTEAGDPEPTRHPSAEPTLPQSASSPAPTAKPTRPPSQPGDSSPTHKPTSSDRRERERERERERVRARALQQDSSSPSPTRKPTNPGDPAPNRHPSAKPTKVPSHSPTHAPTTSDFVSTSTPAPTPTSTGNIQASTCGFDCDNGYNTQNLMSNLQSKLSTFVPDAMADDDDHPGWAAWKAFVCGGDGGRIFSGENLESASPADPSFWVIHPTLERLYHAKLMAGGFDDDSWATDPVAEYVCDKYECYEGGVYGYYTECCDGHYSDSRLIDVGGDRCSYFGMTNEDTMLSTDASSSAYAMEYIFDSFTWEHCLDTNDGGGSFDFDSLLTSLSAAASTGTSLPTLSPTRKPTSKPSYEPTTTVVTSRPTPRPQYTSSPSTTPAPSHRPTHRPTEAPVSYQSICDVVER